MSFLCFYEMARDAERVGLRAPTNQRNICQLEVLLNFTVRMETVLEKQHKICHLKVVLKILLLPVY